MGVRTHLSVSGGTPPKPEDLWKLNPLRRQSVNFRVDKAALSLLVWGLAEGESVAVRRARVASLGSPVWSLDGACCHAVLPPDDNGNVAHMPYVRCGKPVVSDSANPHVVINDVGVFYLVYQGDGEVEIELLPDTLLRKCCCKEQ